MAGPALGAFSQFDAAVNPGNSGGPLLDRRGHVVGTVTGEIAESKVQTESGLSLALDIQAACTLMTATFPDAEGC